MVPGRPRRLMLLAVGVCAVACRGPAPVPYPAVRIPAEEMRRVRTICLESIAIALELPGSAERRAAIEGAFRKALEQLGYTVRGVSETADAAKSVLAASRGFHDPHTGFIDAQGVRRHRAALVRGLHARLGCDALLAAAVVPVYASFVESKASWDDAVQTMGGERDEYGWVRAVSIHTRLHGATGREIYFSTGGVEVLATMTGTFRRKGQVAAPDTILADEWRVRDGVWYSLDALKALRP